MHNKTFRISIILLLSISFVTLPSDITYPSKHKGQDYIYIKSFSDKDQFGYASFLFERGRYIRAASEYGRLIELFPSSTLLDDAQYWMGIAYLKAKHYREAIEQFSLYLKNFPTGRHANEVMADMELASILMKGPIKKTPPSKPPVVVAKPPARRTVEEIETPLIGVQAHILKGEDYKDVDKELRRLKQGGYNLLILRVFHNRGDRFYPFASHSKNEGVYFKTDHAPVIDDILTPVLRIAKRYNIKVFAWMTTRYADYGLEERDDLRCRAYDPEKREYVYCKGLDLFNEDAVRHLEGLYRDLARYPIDGILFQDDLVLRFNEGFGREAERLFKEETGHPLDPEGLYRIGYGDEGRFIVDYTREFWGWAEWKNRRILSVAKRLMDVSRSVNPDIKFAINMMYEAAYKPPQALAWLSQSLENASKVGFDFYSIMAYHRQIEEELNLDFDDTLNILSRMLSNSTEEVGYANKILFKLQLIDWQTRKDIPIDEIEDILREISGRGVNIVFTPYENNTPLSKISSLLKAEGLR